MISFVQSNDITDKQPHQKVLGNKIKFQTAQNIFDVFSNPLCKHKSKKSIFMTSIDVSGKLKKRRKEKKKAFEDFWSSFFSVLFHPFTSSRFFSCAMILDLLKVFGEVKHAKKSRLVISSILFLCFHAFDFHDKRIWILFLDLTSLEWFRMNRGKPAFKVLLLIPMSRLFRYEEDGNDEAFKNHAVCGVIAVEYRMLYVTLEMKKKQLRRILRAI